MRQILLLLFIQSGFWINAQPERISVHFDKSFYASGETIRVSVFLMNEDTAQLKSNVIRAAIFKPDGTLLDRYQLSRLGRCALGNIPLDKNLPEGNYPVRVYTEYNKQHFPENNFETVIPVFDPSLPESQRKTPFIYGKTGNSTGDEGAVDVRFLMPDSVFQQRAAIPVEMSITDQKGQPLQAVFTATVTDVDLIAPRHSSPWQSNKSPGDKNDITRTPDNAEKSLTLNGILKTGDANAHGISPFLAFYLVERKEFLPVYISGDTFRISLPAFEGTQSGQLINWNPFYETDNFDFSEKESAYMPGNMTENRLEAPSINKYLQYYARRKYLESDVFYQKKRSVPSDTTAFVLDFQPDKTFNTSDFIDIKNMEFFFRDGYPSSNVAKEKENTTIRLFNRSAYKNLPNKPLYMVGGFFIADENAVLNLPFEDISQIDLFTEQKTISKYFLRNMAGNGVVSITGKANKLDGFIRKNVVLFPVEGFLESSGFMLHPGDPEVPELSPLIYWQGNNHTVEPGNAAFSFQAGDALTELNVEVIGVTSDGRLFSANKIIRIVKAGR